MAQRIILDTDIGSDVDDAMALALAVKSPNIHLEGVTTVYGDVHVRAALAKKLLSLSGNEQINVYAGLETPLLRNRPVWWAGHEGEGVLSEDDYQVSGDKNAVQYLIDTVMNNPGEITIVAIGPLTNLAAAIILEPEIKTKVKDIVIMGGVTRLGDNGVDLPATEHNIRCDPEAAACVFNSGAPLTMVGLDVTMKVLINREDKEKLEKTNKPLNLALGKLIDRWLEHINCVETAMHDPLAVAVVLDPTIVTKKAMKVEVVYDHRHPTGQTVATLAEESTISVCLDVDVPKFKDLLMSTLL